MSDQPLALVNADSQTALSKPDPDNPHWGIVEGVVVWVLSIGLPAVLQIPFVIADRESLRAGVISPRALFVSVLCAAVGHILILLVCWATITQFGKRPFFATLGWHWGGLSLPKRIFLVIGVILSVSAIMYLLRFILPDNENTAFMEMLKSSEAARYTTAVIAVVSAPLVEELIYRGMLYSGLRKHVPMMPSVLAVAGIFTIVHIPQYSGAWASIAGLFVLSFVLTYIRAKTKSILPSFWIHLVFNMVGAYEIVRAKF